jgi:hypothetical protein
MEKQLHEQIIHQFNKTLSIFAKRFGNIAIESYARNYRVTYATYIRAWLGVIYLITLRISSSRKYIFQEFKNIDLINCLKPENILILGGRSNYRICLERGYGLFWTGGISAAIVLAWRGGSMAPLKLQIKLAKNKLKGRKKYFFLYEDTHAVGIFFALLGSRCSHPTVCIQHGFLQLETPIADGTLCQYNLVYALEQKVIFEKLMKIDTSTFFELGLPFDVNYGSGISNSIVLVGTGEHHMRREFYFRSLDVYIRIKNQLSQRGWHVIYRPHPSELESDYSPYFLDSDTGSKVACLSGPRKIFIGYMSTLLYEALSSGHSVLRLTDPAMTEDVAFTPNVTISPDSLVNIDEVVRGLRLEMKRRVFRKLPSIQDRFLSILRKIELENE